MGIFWSSVKTFQKDHFHPAVGFFVENYDNHWSPKRLKNSERESVQFSITLPNGTSWCYEESSKKGLV